MAELILKDEVYKIVGAAMELYNQLGCGFLEAVYQEAMEIELAEREIPFVRQKQLLIWYKGRQLKKYYVADIVAYESVVVELKASSNLVLEDEGQLINCLHATHMRVGVLLNFGHKGGLEWKRMVV